MPARPRLARSIARAATLAPRRHLTRPELRPREWLEHLVPTRRSLVVGLGILAFALCGYLLARETSLFAVERIEVRGASPKVSAQVHRALASVVGKPLVGLDGSAVLREVDALPTVVRASYDRAFPHTLRVTVVPERPAAVLRSGPASWLVSARGRVVGPLRSADLPKLPRIWVSAHTPVHVGAELTTAGAAVAARAVGIAGTFGARVASAAYTNGELIFRLRSGLALVLGEESDLRLKFAVAERVLELLPAGSAFLDVSVPGRPVSGTGAPLGIS